MRLVIVMVALLFTAALGAYTAHDLATHGPTIPGVLGALVVALLGVALLGALLHSPRE